MILKTIGRDRILIPYSYHGRVGPLIARRERFLVVVEHAVGDLNVVFAAFGVDHLAVSSIYAEIGVLQGDIVRLPSESYGFVHEQHVGAARSLRRIVQEITPVDRDIIEIIRRYPYSVSILDAPGAPGKSICPKIQIYVVNVVGERQSPPRGRQVRTGESQRIVIVGGCDSIRQGIYDILSRK